LQLYTSVSTACTNALSFRSLCCANHAGVE
jgi:hypothetical protein